MNYCFIEGGVRTTCFGSRKFKGLWRSISLPTFYLHSSSKPVCIRMLYTSSIHRASESKRDQNSMEMQSSGEITSNGSSSLPSSASLHRLASAFQQSEAMREEQQLQLSSLRRQVALLEQRLTACEAALENRENQLRDLACVTGELRMETQASSQLVQLLEKRLLITRNGSDSATSLPSFHGETRREDNRTNSSSEIKTNAENDSLIQEILPEVMAAVKNMLEKNSVSSTVHKTEKDLSGKKPQGSNGSSEESDFRLLENLNDRVQSLESAFSALSRVEPLEAVKGDSCCDPRCISSSTKESSPNSEEAASIRNELGHLGVMPFRNLEGKIEVTGSAVRVSGVPYFWGAAHIRELCEAKVGEGKGAVVSCLLSQRASPKSVPIHTNSSVPSGGGERAFDVVFRSTAHAIRALVALNGLSVSSHPKVRHGAGSGERAGNLSVTPILSSVVVKLVKRLDDLMDVQLLSSRNGAHKVDEALAGADGSASKNSTRPVEKTSECDVKKSQLKGKCGTSDQPEKDHELLESERVSFTI